MAATDFSHWHYDFEIDGERTRPDRASWQQHRAAMTVGSAATVYGGTLAGKRVLDLGCNAGYFALKALEAGADFVFGIDGRQEHIDQANLIFDRVDVDEGRYRFEAGNFNEYPLERHGPFDVVLALGVIYHVAAPILFLERIAAVNTDLLVIDTKLAARPGKVIELGRENTEGPLNAVDTSIVMVPTARAVRMMVDHVGYPHAGQIVPSGLDDPSMHRYRRGMFGVFVCSKQSELAGLRLLSQKALTQAQSGESPPRRTVVRRLLGGR